MKPFETGGMSYHFTIGFAANRLHLQLSSENQTPSDESLLQERWVPMVDEGTFILLLKQLFRQPI